MAGFPVMSAMALANTRAVASVSLPGGNGTPERIACAGNAVVCAGAFVEAVPATAAMQRAAPAAITRRREEVKVLFMVCLHLWESALDYPSCTPAPPAARQPQMPVRPPVHSSVCPLT